MSEYSDMNYRGPNATDGSEPTREPSEGLAVAEREQGDLSWGGSRGQLEAFFDAVAFSARNAPSVETEAKVSEYCDAILTALDTVEGEPDTAMVGALKRLVFAARTSGGTAGPDAQLMAACEEAEKLLPTSEGDDR